MLFLNRFAKYDKMKKLLPEGPVRQTMMKDGIAAYDIDVFFDGTLVRGAAQPGAVATVAVVDTTVQPTDSAPPPVEDKLVLCVWSMLPFLQLSQVCQVRQNEEAAA